MLTLKEAVKLRYDLDEESGVPDAISTTEKNFLKSNILDAIKANIELKAFRQTYKEILNTIISKDYPFKFLELVTTSLANLKAAESESDVLAALLPIQILLGRYELVLGPERNQLEALIPQIFPFFENYAIKLVQGGSGEKSVLILQKILRCFLMCNYMTLEPYFQDERLQSFMVIVKTILDAPLDQSSGITLSSPWEDVIAKQNSPEWKLKRVCCEIVHKFMFHIKVLKKDMQQQLRENFT